MSNYPTIRNPLLPSPPSIRRKSFSADSLRSSISTASIRSFMNLTLNQLSTTAGTRIGHANNRRKIMPLMPKSMTEKSMVNHRHQTTVHEPLVHYNGPCHTLESLPLEKLNWIRDEQTSSLVKNPLTDYQRSIVLRKPISRSNTLGTCTTSSTIQHRPSFKPRAMFYFRILQIVSTHSSKTRVYRCGVQVNQETCISSYATSEKTGKHSSIAQFDETFLFDIEQQTTATITVYAQTKGHGLFQKARKEVCIGLETLPLSLYPKAKTTERIVLTPDPSSGQDTTFQLLVVYGTYMSHRTQNMLNNTILFGDFVTVYIQTGMVPRMDRFWGVLRGVQFELYDFEYKENRPPLYMIPLDNFIEAFESTEEQDDEIRVHLGAKGLVLQFNQKAVPPHERNWLQDELECQMYLVPESIAATREWITQFNYVASIFEELREWHPVVQDEDGDEEMADASSGYSLTSSTESTLHHVPLRLLW